jgi:hypothetical protein
LEINYTSFTMENDMKNLAINHRQMLNQNLGLMDRQIRAVIGTLMISIPLFSAPEALGQWSLLILAAIPILTTAIIGWDPLYAAAGISNYERREEDIQQRHWTYSNIGLMDRALRFGIGAMLLYGIFTMPSMSMEMAFALAAIPLIGTAIIAWDPIYAAMSMNSHGSRLDIEAADPEVNEKTLATFYELPNNRTHSKLFANAA